MPRFAGGRPMKWASEAGKRAGGGCRLWGTACRAPTGRRAPAYIVRGTSRTRGHLRLAAKRVRRGGRLNVARRHPSLSRSPTPGPTVGPWLLQAVAFVPSCLRPYVPHRAASLRASVPTSLSVNVPAVLAVTFPFPGPWSLFPPFASCT